MPITLLVCAELCSKKVNLELQFSERPTVEEFEAHAVETFGSELRKMFFEQRGKSTPQFEAVRFMSCAFLRRGEKPIWQSLYTHHQLDHGTQLYCFDKLGRQHIDLTRAELPAPRPPTGGIRICPAQRHRPPPTGLRATPALSALHSSDTDNPWPYKAGSAEEAAAVGARGRLLPPPPAGEGFPLSLMYSETAPFSPPPEVVELSFNSRPSLEKLMARVLKVFESRRKGKKPRVASSTPSLLISDVVTHRWVRLQSPQQLHPHALLSLDDVGSVEEALAANSDSDEDSLSDLLADVAGRPDPLSSGPFALLLCADLGSCKVNLEVEFASRPGLGDLAGHINEAFTAELRHLPREKQGRAGDRGKPRFEVGYIAFYDGFGGAWFALLAASSIRSGAQMYCCQEGRSRPTRDQLEDIPPPRKPTREVDRVWKPLGAAAEGGDRRAAASSKASKAVAAPQLRADRGGSGRVGTSSKGSRSGSGMAATSSKASSKPRPDRWERLIPPELPGQEALPSELMMPFTLLLCAQLGPERVNYEVKFTGCPSLAEVRRRAGEVLGAEAAAKGRVFDLGDITARDDLTNMWHPLSSQGQVDYFMQLCCTERGVGGPSMADLQSRIPMQCPIGGEVVDVSNLKMPPWYGQAPAGQGSYSGMGGGGAYSACSSERSRSLPSTP